MKSYWTTINLKVIRSSETPGTICQSTWRRVLEDLHPNQDGLWKCHMYL